jgi:hypothetical protein
MHLPSFGFECFVFGVYSLVFAVGYWFFDALECMSHYRVTRVRVVLYVFMIQLQVATCKVRVCTQQESASSTTCINTLCVFQPSF